MSLTATPTPAQLRAAPQLAALTILDAALVTAEEVRLAHRPVLDPSTALYGDSSQPDGALVPILIARFDQLHSLLGRYHLAVRIPRRERRLPVLNHHPALPHLSQPMPLTDERENLASTHRGRA